MAIKLDTYTGCKMIKELKQDIAETFAELRYKPEDGVNISDFFDAAMNTLLHARDLKEAKKVIAYLNFFLSCRDDIGRTYEKDGKEIDSMMSCHTPALGLVPDAETRSVCYVSNAIPDDEGYMYYVFHSDEEPASDPFEGFKAQEVSAGTASLSSEGNEIGMVSEWSTLVSGGGTIATGEDADCYIAPSGRAADKAKIYDSRGGYYLEYDYKHDGVALNDRNCKYTVVFDDDAMEVYERVYLERLKKGTAPDKRRMLARIRWCITDWNSITGVARIELSRKAGAIDPDFPLLLAASCLIMCRRMHGNWE